MADAAATSSSSSAVAPPLTLTHSIIADQALHPEATGDFTVLMHSFEYASKYVSSKVRAAGLLNLYGLEGQTNVQGEEVKKIDVLANTAFISALKHSHKVSVMVSEENTDPIIVHCNTGKYAAVFDPLDGSSNIDCNVSIGTIFGIYKKADPTHAVESVLQPGSKLVAAGYAMYGSATIMVLSTGHHVDGFTLDPSTGEYVLTHPKIKVPRRGKIYSVNEGNTMYWDQQVKDYVNSVKFPAPPGKPYSHRYVGSMVADVHRTLLYGGIFMYPADKNSKDGKLRLLYEANPMAFLLEKAGGSGSYGTGRILDIMPTHIHQRTPVFLGSADDVADVEKFFQKK